MKIKTILKYLNIEQCIAAIAAMLFGLIYGAAALMTGDWFLTACFGVIAVIGYVLMWRPAVAEYKKLLAESGDNGSDSDERDE